tara:strand:+ start:174 stop:410 length:237 start_codon:yes stop_codon:yes gene_type:complete
MSAIESQAQESIPIEKKTDPKNIQPVKIKDFDMPFGSMVSFMIKWVLASIPAIMILCLIGIIIVAIFGSILVSIFSYA